MKATLSQLELIHNLAGKYFGRGWREDVDAFCICHGNFEYTGIKNMDNLQAMWLIGELQPRVESMEVATWTA